MISRIEFLYKHYNIEKRIQEKVKLNNKKIKYIIKQKEKGESSKKLAIIYGVTVRYINKIYFNYLEYGKDELYKTGRKTKSIESNTERLVINIRNNYPLSGPLPIEKYLKNKGITISHNIIYRILLKYNMVNEDINKKNQRKYLKYEREHSK